MPKKITVTPDKTTLREFAAEIIRLTNFPLTQDIVEQAIENMPETEKEE